MTTSTTSRRDGSTGGQALARHVSEILHHMKAEPYGEMLVKDTELAERLGVSRRHVHFLRARGVLRAVKLGASLRFPLAENLQMILDGRAAGISHTQLKKSGQKPNVRRPRAKA